MLENCKNCHTSTVISLLAYDDGFVIKCSRCPDNKVEGGTTDEVLQKWNQKQKMRLCDVKSEHPSKAKAAGA